MNIPALAKVGISFACILILNRFKVHLSLGLLTGGILLGLFMNIPLPDIVDMMLRNVFDFQALSLISIVAVILVLSRLMSESGQLSRIVTSFGDLIKSVRIVSMVMPALIGLLPMPGGALFSAPMVESACERSNIKPELKTALNYWFRHMWECWWPLYPGVILAVSLLGMEMWKFLAVGIPMSMVYAASGYFFLVRAMPVETLSIDSDGGESGLGRWKTFRREVRPITLIILAVPAVNLFTVFTGVALPSLTSIFLGLTLCLVLVVVQNRLTAEQILKAALNKATLPMIGLIVGIMAFKGVLVESEAVGAIQHELDLYGIPPVLVVALMPFITGFITGVAVAFVGSSFPLIVPLIADKPGLEFLAYALLAFQMGLLGEMLSPVHICLLVTRDYFNAGIMASYRRLFGPVAVVLSAILLMFFSLRFIG